LLGFGFGTTLLLVWWSLGFQNAPALVLAPLSVGGIAWMLRDKSRLSLRLPLISTHDLRAVAIAMLVVPLVTWAPYANVRREVPDGEAYRAYFTADFIWAMTVTAEIAKGDVPPVNPFHHVEPLRYYWMSHMLSGATYKSLRATGITTESIVLINGLVFGLGFVAFLYWLCRAVGASPAWACAMVLTGFVANSYEGADMIRAIVAHTEPWETLRDTNIDAVTRWFYKGMAVDGLHRLLLYQPHHLTGYGLGLAALWLVGIATDIASIGLAAATGGLLALALLFSTFGALILTLATALVFLLRFLQHGALLAAVRSGIVAGGLVLTGVFLTRAFGYTNPADGLLMIFGLNPRAVHFGPWVFFLSFGPLLLFGVPSQLRPRWSREAGVAPLGLTVAALLFYFFVDVPDMGGVWVGWRSGHMLLIAFATAAAAGLTALWHVADRKGAVAVVFAIAVLLATPTAAVDVFNAQDIDNRHDGAGFPWTLVISPAEREAFDWIRANTAPDAVIQVEPYVRDPATWALVPAFAERRMAAGLPISMAPYARYALASDNVRLGIFQATTADDAHEWAQLLGIDYIFIGDLERRTYRGQVERMLDEPRLFQQVFRNDSVLLLQVVKAGNAAAHLR
jgi:hypothetical protein